MKKQKKAGQRGAKKSRSALRKVGQPSARVGGAKPHGELCEQLVHVFVDDQNLFYGITNAVEFGHSFRIDFGQLLLAAAKNSKGETRGVKSAYIAGVIPDDDTFGKSPGAKDLL